MSRVFKNVLMVLMLASVGYLLTGCDGDKQAVVETDTSPFVEKKQVVEANPQPSVEQQEPEAISEFKAVELDRFIEQEKKAYEKMGNRKLIRKAVPVRFVATIKRLPEQKKLTYIYTALEMAKISPLPDVEHQMFVESKEGQIISVYVEKRAATRLSKDMAEGQTVDLYGYHVYTYTRGPAILVADFAPTSK